MSAIETEQLEISAERIGADHGAAAATWVDVDDEGTARRLLDGINDGDPEILDQLPPAPLSDDGDYTPADLADDLDVDTAGDALCDAYRRGFTTAVESALAVRCAAYLADR